MPLLTGSAQGLRLSFSSKKSNRNKKMKRTIIFICVLLSGCVSETSLYKDLHKYDDTDISIVQKALGEPSKIERSSISVSYYFSYKSCVIEFETMNDMVFNSSIVNFTNDCSYLDSKL